MRLLTLLLGIAVTAPVSAEGWTCLSDWRSGYSWDGASRRFEPWSESYPAVDGRYVIRRPAAQDPQPSASMRWVVFLESHRVPVSYCVEDFDAKGELVCAGFQTVRFSRRSLRFVAVDYSFAVATDEVLDDPPDYAAEATLGPVLDIGRCRGL